MRPLHLLGATVEHTRVKLLLQAAQSEEEAYIPHQCRSQLRRSSFSNFSFHSSGTLKKTCDLIIWLVPSLFLVKSPQMTPDLLLQPSMYSLDS